MPLIDREAEQLRKQRLKELEDKRMQFAARLQKEGFQPEKMLFCSDEKGGFVALARHNDRAAVIVGPIFGSADDFTLDYLDQPEYRKEEVFEKSQGLGGAFGFGKKGASGFELIISLSDEREARLAVVSGRTSYLECALKKNPLLQLKRRRGDANIVWDMKPIERGDTGKIDVLVHEYYLKP